jgi:hypothetical protein
MAAIERADIEQILRGLDLEIVEREARTRRLQQSGHRKSPLGLPRGLSSVADGPAS